MVRILKSMIFIFLVLIFSCSNSAEERTIEERRINESAISEITTSFYNSDSIILGTLHRIDKNGSLPWSDSHGFTDISENEFLETDDLFAIVKIFRPDEADHRVDQQGIEFAGHGVGPGLTGLLIHPVMGSRRQRASLAGLKIHHIVPQHPPFE